MAIKKNRFTPQDIEDVIACGYPLAQIARESGIDRISLSKFRNHGQALKAHDQAALITWLQENDLWEEGSDATPLATSKSTPATYAAQVFPLPSIIVPIGEGLSEADRNATIRSLNAIVRENDQRMEFEAKHGGGVFGLDENDLTDESKADYDELRAGLTAEAVLRRVLDGSFNASRPERKPSNLAEMLAHEYLRDMAMEVDTEHPSPAAPSSDAESVAADASSKAVGEMGAKRPSTFLEMYSAD